MVACWSFLEKHTVVDLENSILQLDNLYWYAFDKLIVKAACTKKQQKVLVCSYNIGRQCYKVADPNYFNLEHVEIDSEHIDPELLQPELVEHMNTMSLQDRK